MTNCSGECCVCACGDLCLAGRGDDDFTEASVDTVIKRLENNQYSSYKSYMIDWLKSKGYEYKDINEPTCDYINCCLCAHDIRSNNLIVGFCASKTFKEASTSVIKFRVENDSVQYSVRELTTMIDWLKEKGIEAEPKIVKKSNVRYICCKQPCCLCKYDTRAYSVSSTKDSCTLEYDEAGINEIKYRISYNNNYTQEEVEVMQQCLSDDLSNNSASTYSDSIDKSNLERYDAFARMIADFIFAGDFSESNIDFFCEISCRKLNELGILKAEGKDWVYENDVPNLFDNGNITDN